MAIALAVTGVVLLAIAGVMFVRSSKSPGAGGATTNRRAIMILTALGLLFGLASQLPVFRG